MGDDTMQHGEIEKAGAFLAIVLSEQTGPLTDLQRDFLTSVRSTLSRIEEVERAGPRQWPMDADESRRSA